MKNPIKPMRWAVLAAIVGLAALASGCATQDETASLAPSDRECRSLASPGTKMRQSVCMSRAQWAAVDAREAERQNKEGQTEEFLRQQRELSTQQPGPAFDTAL